MTASSLRVDVFQVRGIPYNKNDPYAIVTFGSASLRTSTISNNVEAIWNEAMIFPISDAQNMPDIVVQVRDSDAPFSAGVLEDHVPGLSDPIGVAVIKFPGPVEFMWYDIRDSGQNIAGEILLSISFTDEPGPLTAHMGYEPSFPEVLTNVWSGCDNMTPESSFPEMELPRFQGVKKLVGLCFSGGGTRSMTASMGQMHALHKHGLLEKAHYISCVSGGSWASTILEFSDVPLDELLSPVLPPTELTPDIFEADIPKTSMVEPCTQHLLLEIAELDVKSEFGYRQRIWVDAIGQLYLQQFGLFHPRLRTLYSLNEGTVAMIKDKNPILRNERRFKTVRTDVKMPYLVVNSCILGPTDWAPFKGDPDLVGFEYTPLYVGSSTPYTVEYKSKGWLSTRANVANVGGAYVEPFAFGSDERIDVTVREQKLAKPRATHELVDTTGTSSAAPSQSLVTHGVLGYFAQFAPTAHFHTTQKPHVPDTSQLSFGDGGNLDNTGLLALLRRRVPSNIVFVNSNVLLLPYGHDLDVAQAKESDSSKRKYVGIDSTIPAFFGVVFEEEGVVTRNNAVFEPEMLDKLVEALRILKRDGEPLIVKQELKVVENELWGIKGGWTTEVLWVYLSSDDAFEKDLKSFIKDQLPKLDKEGRFTKGDGVFDLFPHYKTAGNNHTLVTLTKGQIRLLASLTSSQVTRNIGVFKSMF